MKPTAGYYMFPNFELLRDAFSKRGILTCEQMCAAMLEEAKVAVSTKLKKQFALFNLKKYMVY